MDRLVKIENWSIHAAKTNDKYLAPELIGISLMGNVFDHPEKGDAHVITSKIVKVDGRIVTTKSGTRYLLGKINPSYREYLRTIRPNWDENNPISVLDCD